MKIPMEDWLRGCVYHDGRHGEVTLSTDRVLEIADYIQLTRTSIADGMIELPPYEPKTEPQTEHLEQFRVGLEYHTDTTHFGKTKGENVTTNRIEDEPQTETCTGCKFKSGPFCTVDGDCKYFNRYEPQIEDEQSGKE